MSTGPAGLIESWRYRGEPTPWDAIVGHAQQVARCREAVEKLSRDPPTWPGCASG